MNNAIPRRTFLKAASVPMLARQMRAAEAPPYRARLSSGVSFQSTDPALQRVFDAAEKKAAANIQQFNPAMKILVEGGGYNAAWIETQPMGGEMYAKRDPQIALNNQTLFLLAQRPDGRMPALVHAGEKLGQSKELQDTLRDVPQAMRSIPGAGVVADYRHFQGYCFPSPAWKMYFWAGKDRGYLAQLYKALEAHDAYLWRTRDSNGDGLLETWCFWDTGEDAASRFLSRNAPTFWPFDRPPLAPGTPDPQNPGSFKLYWPDLAERKLAAPQRTEVRVPFASMDVMGYSYDGRMTLARIARELDNGREGYWREQAGEVRQRVIKGLWLPEKHACYDRDRDGKILPELIHNNLRVMYHGLFTQEMADQFVRYHLLNPDEFWTPVPLPSVAIHDPLYRNEPGNSWSGQPQGLTYQRAIRALENYGHYAELSLIGARLLEVVARNGFTFPQQLDASTGAPSGPKPDGYGPMLLASLEYISHLHGVHLVVDEDRVWWSSLRPAHDFTYTQRWGTRTFTLTCEAGRMRARLNQRELFACTSGVRVVTDVDGKLREVVGIQAKPQEVTLDAGGRRRQLAVSPNQVYGLEGATPAILRAAPFDYPYRPPG